MNNATMPLLKDAVKLLETQHAVKLLETQHAVQLLQTQIRLFLRTHLVDTKACLGKITLYQSNRITTAFIPHNCATEHRYNLAPLHWCAMRVLFSRLTDINRYCHPTTSSTSTPSIRPDSSSQRDTRCQFCGHRP